MTQNANGAKPSQIRQLAGVPVLPNLAGNEFLAEASPTGVTGLLKLYDRPLAMLIMSPDLARKCAAALIAAADEYDQQKVNDGAS